MRSSAPRPDRSFAVPFGNILGSKLFTGATIRPNFVFCFSFLQFFGSFLFIILFPFYSPFQFLLIFFSSYLFLSLLILLAGAILRLLFLLSFSISSYSSLLILLFLSLLISSYSSRRCYSSSSYSSFFDTFGVKIHVYTGATIRPNYFCFILFY